VKFCSKASIDSVDGLPAGGYASCSECYGKFDFSVLCLKLFAKQFVVLLSFVLLLLLLEHAFGMAINLILESGLELELAGFDGCLRLWSHSKTECIIRESSGDVDLALTIKQIH
jgi:hypothetical protein